MTDAYVVEFSQATIIQIIMHITTIVVLVGCLAISIYVLILLVKLAKRGIRALDIYRQDRDN